MRILDLIEAQTKTNNEIENCYQEKKRTEKTIRVLKTNSYPIVNIFLSSLTSFIVNMDLYPYGEKSQTIVHFNSGGSVIKLIQN